MNVSKTYKTSEGLLLTHLRQGVPAAVEYWFKTYHDQVLRFVLTKVAVAADAEELVQETFVNALKQLAFFRGDSSLATWLQSIARHEVADYYRKKYAKKAIHSLPLSEVLANTLLPTKVHDSHATSERVKVAIQSLTHEHQELLLSKYLDGKKVEELAQELGRSVKSIESELFRARQAFKLAYAQLD